MHLDEHEGQRVSRRRLITGISALGFGGVLAACSSAQTPAEPSATPSPSSDAFAEANTCALTPTTTQGPYYFDADKVRSDIREDREGKRLRVAIKVQDSERCEPLADAVVEIWHCDADGLYSGAEALSSGGGGGVPRGAGGDLTPQDDKRYLRGAQVTNAEGVVEFTTVWPGWYRGRTTHIHAMVHVDSSRVLISQMMFDESINAKVYQEQPYASHAGRDTFNDNDNIYEDKIGRAHV